MYCMYSVSGHETMCTRAAHRADCFLARLLHEQAARRQEIEVTDPSSLGTPRSNLHLTSYRASSTCSPFPRTLEQFALP